MLLSIIMKISIGKVDRFPPGKDAQAEWVDDGCVYRMGRAEIILEFKKYVWELSKVSGIENKSGQTLPGIIRK